MATSAGPAAAREATRLRRVHRGYLAALFDEVLTITIDVPHAVGADEVTDCQSQSYKGWGTGHAMRADGDIVIDVQVTGERLDDQAVRVVNAIVVHGRV